MNFWLRTDVSEFNIEILGLIYIYTFFLFDTEIIHTRCLSSVSIVNHVSTRKGGWKGAGGDARRAGKEGRIDGGRWVGRTCVDEGGRSGVVWALH